MKLRSATRLLPGRKDKGHSRSAAAQSRPARPTRPAGPARAADPAPPAASARPEEVARSVPGGTAARPTEIPKAGWQQIVKRAWAESKADSVPLLAAGVAFYSFLAIFPGLIAAVLVYGLVADPAQVQRQIDSVGAALPAEAQNLLSEQMRQIAGGSEQSLGLGLVVALVAALWSASGGMAGLIKATNVAYDEEEKRGFVKLRLLALAMTLGGIVFLALAVALVAVLPAVFDAVGLGTGGRLVAEVIRWVLLVVAVMAALAIVYRYAPDRDAPKLAWASIGAVVATVIWVAGSVAFSVYVDNFGKYGKTYGSLAGVVVLLLWLFLTAYAVLLGAEVNAEAEQQTVRDTTQGPEKPLGQRDAVKADTVPSS